MRKLIFPLLVCCLIAEAATAQLSVQGKPQTEPFTGQGPGNRAVLGLVVDQKMWGNGPLARITEEETRFFRTFRVGLVSDNARVDYAGEEAMLIGLDVNLSSPSRRSETPKIIALRGIYLTGGKRVYGAVFGDARGRSERVLAKEGHAVHEIVFGDSGDLRGLVGVTVRFAPILPTGKLDSGKVYSAPSVGSGGGTVLDAKSDTAALPFCGLYVAPGDENAPINAVAMLVSQRLVQEVAPDQFPRQTGPLSPQTRLIPSAPAPDSPPTTREVVIIRERVVTQLDPSFAEFIKTHSDRLFFIEGAAGTGSAFTCRFHGKTYLFTNQHVVAGNANVKFAGLTKAQLKVGDALAASGHDIMAYPVDEGTPAFELVEDLATNVAIGDAVAVLGDAEGAGVVRPIAGRVAGVGPNLIEVSAEFLPGNSGSPIIHLKTGRVIGIATYATAQPVIAGDLGTVDVHVRRFGYRIDSVQKWQPVHWPIYQADAAALRQATGLTESLLKLCKDVRDGSFNRKSHTDPRLQPAFLLFPMRAPLKEDQATRVRDGFIKELRRIAKLNSDTFRSRIRYDYLRQMLDQENASWELLLQGIEEKKRLIHVWSPN